MQCTELGTAFAHHNQNHLKHLQAKSLHKSQILITANKRFQPSLKPEYKCLQYIQGTYKLRHPVMILIIRTNQLFKHPPPSFSRKND